jgi:hypothetical protein
MSIAVNSFNCHQKAEIGWRIAPSTGQLFADTLNTLRLLLGGSLSSAQDFIDRLINAPSSIHSIPSLSSVLSGRQTSAEHAKQLSELATGAFPTVLIARLLLAILTDTRIILVCSDLSRLASLSIGLLSLLFPFHWDYMFAPILPPSLVPSLQNPAPFIAGIHKSVLPAVDLDEVDDHLLVDLDDSVIIRRGRDSIPDWAQQLGAQIGSGSTDELRAFVTRVLCQALGVQPSNFARTTAKRMRRALLEHRALKGFASDLFDSGTVQPFRDAVMEESLPSKFLPFLGACGTRRSVTSLAIQQLDEFPERKSRRSASSDSDSSGSSRG